MRGINYYHLLGLGLDASPSDIKRAFHFRILSIHPDVNPEDLSAKEQTLDLIEAYRVLGDPFNKQQYDLALIQPVTHVYKKPLFSRFEYLGPKLKMLLALTSLVMISILLVFAIAADHTPVYRPLLTEVSYPSTLKRLPEIVEPTIMDCMEWYHAQEYQLSLADSWSTCEMIDLYTKSARRAESRGDNLRAQFYQVSISTLRKASVPLIM